MNEKIITAIIGLAVGLVLIGAIAFGPKIIEMVGNKNFVSPAPITTPTPTPSILATTDNLLSINKPLDNELLTSNIIEVSGKYLPNKNLLVVTPAEEKMVQTNTEGNYSVSVKIEDGQNVILVATTDPEGKVLSLTKQVYLDIEP